MERRGRIPVAKFRTSEVKARSRSRAREQNFNESSELDSFTLLEENIALKEEIHNLKGTINNQQENVKKLEDKNAKLCKKVENLMDETKEERTRIQLKELNLKSVERKQSIFSEDYNKELCISPTTKKLLTQIKHEIKADTSNTDIERLINLCKNNNRSNGKDATTVDYHDDDDEENMSPLNCIQKLLTEFSNLKININNLELQLYEANEKISDLLENQNHMEQENKYLKEKLSTMNSLLKENDTKGTDKEEVEISKETNIKNNDSFSNKIDKGNTEFANTMITSKNTLSLSSLEDVQAIKSNKISVNIDETNVISKMTNKDDEISFKNKKSAKQSTSTVQSSDRIVEMVLTL